MFFFLFCFFRGKAICPSSVITGCIKLKIGELTSNPGFPRSALLSHGRPRVVLWGHCDTVRFLEQNSTVAFQPGWWGCWEVVVTQGCVRCIPFVSFQEILARCPWLSGYLG